MRAELRPAQHAPVAHQAMVVRLLQAVVALDQWRHRRRLLMSVTVPCRCRRRIIVVRCRRRRRRGGRSRCTGIELTAAFGGGGGHLLGGRQTALVVGHLAEAGQTDVLEFAVLPAMCNDLVRVRADEGALQAVEV